MNPKAEFRKRTSAGPDQGFVALYRYTSGGSENRNTNVEFICDPNADPKAKLTTAPLTESPLKTYNLQWISKHACPVGKESDGDGDGDGDGGHHGGGDSGPAISGGWIFIIL